MGMPLLSDIVIIFGLSIMVLFVFNRLRIPAIVGFLLTGVLAGPYGLGLIKAIHEVEVLAEIGVVLLLFTIGMEFSLKALLRIKKSILLGGSLQVLLTILVTFVLASLQIGRTFGESLFIGFLVCLSSTAIVLKLLQEKAEMDSPHGQTSLAILIFQDLIVIPMMLFTPLLAGMGGEIGQSLLILFAKGAGVIVLVILSAKWIVPQLLYQIARTRSRELFLADRGCVVLRDRVVDIKCGIVSSPGGVLGWTHYIRIGIQLSGTWEHSALSGRIHEFLFRLCRYAAGCRFPR